MNSKHLKTIAITAVLMGILSVSAFATSIGGAAVSTDSLKFYTEPNANASVLSMSPQDSLVVVGEKINDSWYKVVYRGAIGYMPSEFLNFRETLEGDFGKGTIFGDDVYLHDDASLNSNLLETFDNGTEMQVLGVYGNWYKVKYGNLTGFVFSDDFSLNGGVSDLSASSDEGQTIVDTAMKYLGVHYVWGGTTENGFDCSGLVYYVYKECGYTLNRTAAGIYKNGTYVEKTDLQVGDPICFSSSSSSIGHVGIYIGNGQFIHSSSGSGCVIISNLSDRYYTNHYVGARHII